MGGSFFKQEETMKYCLRYSNKSKRLAEADEISIIYDRQDVALLTFLEEHKAQTIILMVDKVKEFDIYQEWKKLNAIHDKYPEYKIEVCFNHKEVPAIVIIELGEKLNIPWFSNVPITDWDSLYYFIEGGVHQVYVAEELGFDLEAVSTFVHAHNALVRVYPNVAQASVKGANQLKKFFIRPDDIDFYSQYVDVCEFWCDYDQQDVYYKIYTSGKWFGPLKEIIKDFDCDIDNRYIISPFAKYRVNCTKQCLKGHYCQMCDKVYMIVQTMKGIK